MNRASAFVLASLPALALAQYRWLGSRKERSFRDFVELIDWQWVLPAVAVLALIAFIARRRWWHSFFVWTPSILAVVLVVLLGARNLVGFFFDRVDAERGRRPAAAKKVR